MKVNELISECNRAGSNGTSYEAELFLAAQFNHFSIATETTGGEILVAFWSKHDLRSDLRVPNLKKNSEGACFQTTLACSHISIR